MASDQTILEQLEQANQQIKAIEETWAAMDTHLEASDGTGAPDEVMSFQHAATTLGHAIIDVVKNHKHFGCGDVAFILDPSDLTKTLLISHNQLNAAINLPQISATDSPSKIKCALILRSGNDGAQMPLLEKIDPAQAVNDFYDQFCVAQDVNIKMEDEIQFSGCGSATRPNL